MRKDMFELIIERPRGGGGRWKAGRKEERTERAFERASSKVGMLRGGAGRTKYLSENLAPLKRFLRRRRGQPWNRVRSEICAVITVASAVQKHVMDHVKQFVLENPLMIDGKPHHPEAMGGAKGEYRPLRGHDRWPSFYVCPKTGLLREALPEPRKRTPKG